METEEVTPLSDMGGTGELNYKKIPRSGLILGKIIKNLIIYDIQQLILVLERQ